MTTPAVDVAALAVSEVVGVVPIPVVGAHTVSPCSTHTHDALVRVSRYTHYILYMSLLS